MAPKHSRRDSGSTGRGLLVFACVFVALADDARACYDGPAVSAGRERGSRACG